MRRFTFAQETKAGFRISRVTAETEDAARELLSRGFAGCLGDEPTRAKKSRRVSRIVCDPGEWKELCAHFGLTPDLVQRKILRAAFRDFHKA